MIPDKQFIKQLSTDSFNGAVIITPILALLLTPGIIIINPPNNVQNTIWIVLHVLIYPIISVWSWQLVRRNKQDWGLNIFFGSHLIMITINIILHPTEPIFLLYLYGYFIVISSTLIKPDSSFSVWFITILLMFGALYLRGQFFDEIIDAIGPAFLGLGLAAVGFFTTLDWQEAVQHTSTLQERAQHRRDELFAAQDELQRINNRQKFIYTQLLTSMDIGQRLVALLDLETLLQQIVDLIQTRLNFAYVGIFLLENNGTHLVLQAQTGEKTSSHSTQSRLSINEENTLTLTVQRGQITEVSDIRHALFPPHPYLSQNTLSEIALPLEIGHTLLGVLNIQSYGVHTFDKEHRAMLRLLANQVSIALHNARLYNDAILARQEAEQANEIKSRFLANMSHELRTPLNAILNFTGFVADGVFGEINPDQADALEKTQDSGAHLLSLINDILDLAKVEAGVMDMFIQDIDIQNLLKSTAATGRGLLKNKPVELILNIDEDLSTISGDKRRLRQILLNLISNAVKFTPEGHIIVTAQEKEELIEISVEDSGIGIPVEDQSLIFDTFHQAPDGAQNEVGTGLGLPIAKQFVEAHGGQMWLESEFGKGSTFFITLPIKQIEDALVTS